MPALAPDAVEKFYIKFLARGWRQRDAVGRR